MYEGWPSYVPETRREPQYVDAKDFNPDHGRSYSRRFIRETDNEVLWVLEVRGFGAVCMRATRDRAGRWEFNGLSSFTDAEIGHRT